MNCIRCYELLLYQLLLIITFENHLRSTLDVAASISIGVVTTITCRCLCLEFLPAYFQSEVVSDTIPIHKSWTFVQLAEKYSECKSSKLGGDLGWIPRAKPGTAGPFQEVAFSTPVGSISTVFRSS